MRDASAEATSSGGGLELPCQQLGAGSWELSVRAQLSERESSLQIRRALPTAHRWTRAQRSRQKLSAPVAVAELRGGGATFTSAIFLLFGVA